MAQGRYSFDDDLSEQDAPGLSNTAPRYPQQYQQLPNTSSPPRARPGAHPDSSFDRLRAQRRRSQSGDDERGHVPYAAPGLAHNDPPAPRPPPPPPQHRYSGHEMAYTPQQRPVPRSTITPGADNFSEAAAGGMAGIALTVAEHSSRESGMNAVQGSNYPQQIYHQQGLRPIPGQGPGEQGIRGPADLAQPRPFYSHGPGSDVDYRPSGTMTPGQRSSSSRSQSVFNEIYTDDPYQSYSRPQDPALGVVIPHQIEDDGDDGLHYVQKGPRTSMLSLGGSSNRSQNGKAVLGAAAGGAVAGGVIGGMAGRNGSGGLHGHYAPVNNGNGSGGSTTGYDAGQPAFGPEKAWQGVHASKSKGKRWRLIIIIVIAVLIALGIALGIVFGTVLKNRPGNTASNAGGSAASDTAKNGDLDINSAEIQSLLNHPDLHKVFPGIDYTPLNTQYPDCTHNPPSQNNITRDLALLSQLTNTVRLYGTDCNQTQMLIHSINQLKLQDTVKIWLGVWQDNNATTNARQLKQMWEILDEYGDKPFKGLIVANEILFREQMTIDELGNLLAEVRTNLTSKGLSLPVATSDLGDKWTASLAQKSDYIMANIHPFFAGVNAETAAGWTDSFWNNHNGPFFKSDKSKNIISEVGWPSTGGKHCGTESVTDCSDPAVAGITEMNQLMSDWVCPALENGTEYFWFEAFDEPWKIMFNTEDENWEDKWGLIDVNRNLKSGVKIPDCGGKTV
ncbi:glycoside hydrolase superfamily [Bombardia bombarda]|uniref:glucan endo-1,3-beta-D-glucosidase n=1 Tax=Bombardia bombarda TaxID=252184 RepID=A0AA39X7G8_9PEZI|nr:glycoside hydrolase superfamily [Bombardia bombarda]